MTNVCGDVVLEPEEVLTELELDLDELEAVAKMYASDAIAMRTITMITMAIREIASLFP